MHESVIEFYLVNLLCCYGTPRQFSWWEAVKSQWGRKSSVLPCVASELWSSLPLMQLASGIYWFMFCDFSILHWTREGSVIVVTIATTAAAPMDAATHTAKIPVCPLNFVLPLSRLRGLGEGCGCISFFCMCTSNTGDLPDGKGRPTREEKKKDRTPSKACPIHLSNLVLIRNSKYMSGHLLPEYWRNETIHLREMCLLKVHMSDYICLYLSLSLSICLYIYV